MYEKYQAHGIVDVEDTEQEKKNVKQENTKQEKKIVKQENTKQEKKIVKQEDTKQEKKIVKQEDKTVNQKQQEKKANGDQKTLPWKINTNRVFIKAFKKKRNNYHFFYSRNKYVIL